MFGSIRVLFLASLAMVAFAANSVIGRMGLVDTNTGAGGFALIRLVSGALMLAIIIAVQGKRPLGSWAGGFFLFLYAACFSYAYILLPAGTGALILFGVVQVTMLGWARVAGERLSLIQILGLVVATAALVWLIMPGLGAPSLVGAVLMAFSGLAWGVYSLLGRKSGDPAATTTGNFFRASIVALACLPPVLFLLPEPLPDRSGVLLAIFSGAVTSGLGYIIWYAALPHLSASKAGIAQLSVPAIAAFGGVVFIDEAISFRLAVSGAAILLGVALAVLTRTPRVDTPKQ